MSLQSEGVVDTVQGYGTFSILEGTVDCMIITDDSIVTVSSAASISQLTVLGGQSISIVVKGGACGAIILGGALNNASSVAISISGTHMSRS